MRRLVADLSLPVEVVGCPTVREPDGAGPLEPQRLPHLERARRRPCSTGPSPPAGAAIAAGERDGAAVSHGDARGRRRPSRSSDLDYAAAVDAADLDEVATIVDPAGDVRLLIAAAVGRPASSTTWARTVDDHDSEQPSATSPVHSLERIG